MYVGFGVGWKGHYATSMLESFARGMKSAASHLSYTNKFMLLTGEAMKIMYNGNDITKNIILSKPIKLLYLLQANSTLKHRMYQGICEIRMTKHLTGMM